MRFENAIALLLVSAVGCSAVVDVDRFLHLGDGAPVLCDPPPPGACASEGMSYHFIYSVGDVGRLHGEGVADGFDLDGTAVSVCRQPDYVSPDGEPGIDNQFAPLIAPLEDLGMIDIRDLSRQAAVEGRSLRFVEMLGVDDLENDPCVTFQLRDAALPTGVTVEDLDRLPPMGWIDPGLAFDYSRPTAHDGEACIRDGRVYAQFPDTVNRLVIGEASPELVVQRNRISAHVEQLEDGSVILSRAVQGGSVDAEDLDAAFTEALRTPISGVAPPDLDPDHLGRCQSVSTAFTFETVPARAGLPID